MSTSQAGTEQERLWAIASMASRLERLPFTRYQLGLFAVLATAWFFDSVDLGALTFLLGSIKSDFKLDAAGTGLVSSISFVGMFFGASLSGMLADRFGRKAIFQLSMVFWGLGSLSCGLSESLDVFAVSRLLVGFGMGMEFPVAQAIASEIAPRKTRGQYLAGLEGFWPVGFIAAGFLAYWIIPVAGWRFVFIVEAVPALFLLVVRRVVPESPRWLMQRGRRDDAERVMADMERRVEERLRAPLPPAPTIVLPEMPKSHGSNFFGLWTGVYLRRTIMLWLLWFFALLGYYGITTWLSALLQQSGYSVTKSILYPALISLAGIPGFIMSVWLIEVVGRKPIFAFTLLGGAAAAFMYGTATDFTHLIVFGCVMQFFLFGMWSVLYAYTPELYPTRSRATGAGWASAIGRVGSLIGPTLVGVILPVYGKIGVFGMGAGAFVLAAIVVLSFGEETKGRLVEEISS